jgi:hypothetical protein
MTGFLGNALLTIFFASIPAYYDAKEKFQRYFNPEWEDWRDRLEMQQQMQQGQQQQQQQQQQQPQPQQKLTYSGELANLPELALPIPVQVCRKLLGALADLQVITGMAVLIAGFAQWPGITYYHEQFVVQYWWLTLNSFWAARMDFGYEDEDEHWRFLIRRLAITVTSVLFVTFNGMVLYREQKHWDAFEDGLCYIYHDTSSNASLWFWETGTCIYILFLFLSFFHPTKKWLKSWRRGLQKWCRSFGRITAHHWREFKEPGESSHWRSHSLFLCIACAFWTALFWAAVQFIALWCFGKGFYAFEICWYIGLFGWGLYDLVDLKTSNAQLVRDSEVSWGFGQVLPVVLLVIVVFSCLDAYRGMSAAIIAINSRANWLLQKQRISPKLKQLKGTPRSSWT